MNDPRTKRPTPEELMDKRHRKWLRSLQSRTEGTDPVVIRMPGKTASILTEREIEILQLISFGFNSEQIAEKLCLSRHTIDAHRKNMLSRSWCGNVAELVRVAINENLL